MRNACNASLAQAKKAIDKKQWGLAYEAVAAAVVNAVDGGLQGQVIETAKLVEAAGMAWMAEADDAYKAKNFEHALDLYRQVARMSQFKIAKQAQVKLAAALKDPEVKAAQREDSATRQWDRVKKMITPADKAAGAAAAANDFSQEKALLTVKALPDADQIKVMGALESLSQGLADTASGKEAATLRQSLLGDSQFATKFERARKDNMARQDYLMGQQYLRTGPSAKAAEFFQKAIDDSPESEWAVRARQELHIVK